MVLVYKFVLMFVCLLLGVGLVVEWHLVCYVLFYISLLAKFYCGGTIYSWLRGLLKMFCMSFFVSYFWYWW